MKKSILFTLLFSFCFLLAYSQIQERGIEVGFHLQPGHSSIVHQNAYGYTELDPEFHFAFSIGVHGGITFTERWSILSEYNFSRLGGKWSGEEGILNVTREVRLEYWQIPLLLRYNWMDKPRFYLTAGPQISLLKSAQQIYDPEVNVSDGRPLVSTDITERFKKTIFGIVLGAGYEIPVTYKYYALVGIRFNYSFSAINHKDYHIPNRSGEYDASHIIFPSMELGAGYIFGRGR